MADNPFRDLTRKASRNATRARWADALLRPFRPDRIDPDRPGAANLLLIGVDTLRADHLGFGGYGSPTSPHLDRLAAGGTVFSDVTAAAPWTLPSFASALTGSMPGLHGGYLTGAVRNMDRQPPRRLSDPVRTLATDLRERGYRTAAFYSNQFFAFGLAESFDHHEYHNLPADDLARRAGEWIRRHADRPFFCFLLFNDPHEPTTPPMPDLEPFLPRAAAAGSSTDPRSIRALARWGEDSGMHLGQPEKMSARDMEAAIALKLAIYDATIVAVDRTIGELQEQLRKWDLADRTLVSMFSDHGEEFGDHAEFSRTWNHDPRGLHGVGHGHTHFQELLHVPWTAWGPGVPAGVRRREPVSLCDLAPTVLGWLGHGSSEESEPRDATATGRVTAALRGRDLSRPEQSAAEDRLLLAEAIAYGPDLVALRRGDWKFIAHRDGTPLGLFDLDSDPRESRDATAGNEEIVADFQELLAAWRATGKGADGGSANEGAPESGAPGSWNELDDTVRRRLKELGYSD